MFLPMADVPVRDGINKCDTTLIGIARKSMRLAASITRSVRDSGRSTDSQVLEAILELSNTYNDSVPDDEMQVAIWPKEGRSPEGTSADH